MEMQPHDILSTARELAYINYVLTKRETALEEENERLLIENFSLQARLDEALGIESEDLATEADVIVDIM